MNFDLFKNGTDIKNAKDDATIIAEHSAILLHYKQTGCLDRDDAIKNTSGVISLLASGQICRQIMRSFATLLATEFGKEIA